MYRDLEHCNAGMARHCLCLGEDDCSRKKLMGVPLHTLELEKLSSCKVLDSQMQVTTEDPSMPFDLLMLNPCCKLLSGS